MTREQRQALRESLEAAGYKRDSFTSDVTGTGSYTEYWSLGENLVIIAWGPRVR